MCFSSTAYPQVIHSLPTRLSTGPSAAELAQIIRERAREAGLSFEEDRETGERLDDVFLTAPRLRAHASRRASERERAVIWLCWPPWPPCLALPDQGQIGTVRHW